MAWVQIYLKDNLFPYDTPHFTEIYLREPFHFLPSEVERDLTSLCGSCCWLTQMFQLYVVSIVTSAEEPLALQWKPSYVEGKFQS